MAVLIVVFVDKLSISAQVLKDKKQAGKACFKGKSEQNLVEPPATQ